MAIDVSPTLISAHYNLSQAYREMLVFDEGNNIYLRAIAIDQKYSVFARDRA